MTKYKGKNIRVTPEAHQAAVDHCGKKLIIGSWVSEAITEKINREGIPTLDRQDWPLKKETK